jgi:anti-sigma regulatory factor (Ser/Thr protein kinase)
VNANTGRMRFRLTPQAPGRARRWADELIDLTPDVQATVVLLLSELVANSVRHSGCPPADEVEVLIQRTGGGVHVEVRDPGPGEGIEASDALEHSGLRIVDVLSDRWGVRRDPTTVWFEVG